MLISKADDIRTAPVSSFGLPVSGFSGVSFPGIVYKTLVTLKARVALFRLMSRVSVCIADLFTFSKRLTLKVSNFIDDIKVLMLLPLFETTGHFDIFSVGVVIQ